MFAKPATTRILSLLCLCVSLLVGCGQRGPLYLPEKGAAETPTGQTEVDEEESKQTRESQDDTIR